MQGLRSATSATRGPCPYNGLGGLVLTTPSPLTASPILIAKTSETRAAYP